MVTMAGKHSDVSKMIEAMTELEYDAIAAYEAAIERFDSTTYKAKFQEFVKDHYQHVQGLKSFHAAFNVENVDGPDAKVVLTKGKIVVADLFGDDAIMSAMVTNEMETVMAYEQACKRTDLPDTLRTLVEKGLQDETRHRDWMKQAVSQSKKAA